MNTLKTKLEKELEEVKCKLDTTIHGGYYAQGELENMRGQIYAYEAILEVINN